MAEMTGPEMESAGLVEAGHMYGCSRQDKAHRDGHRPMVFMNEHDKARDDWHAVAWTDANKVERLMLLCPECWGKYQAILGSFQRDMQEFENEGVM